MSLGPRRVVPVLRFAGAAFCTAFCFLTCLREVASCRGSVLGVLAHGPPAGLPVVVMSLGLLYAGRGHPRRHRLGMYLVTGWSVGASPTDL